jgi:hypothetical protein
MYDIELSAVLRRVKGREAVDLVFRPGDDRADAATPVGGVVLYGRVVITDPELRVLYRREWIERKAGKDLGLPTFNLLLADFSNALAIAKVDLSGYTGAIGDQIIIHLKKPRPSVRVTLTDPQGNTLERGAAKPAGDDQLWVYTAKEKVNVGKMLRIAVGVA